jgi:predicted PhzF superfamily epimerase YddE/YHI9
MNFIAIELPNLEALGKAAVSGVELVLPTDKGWDGFIGSLLYVITSTPAAGKPVQMRTRMLQSNMEDPATGSASCALSAFLAMKLKLGKRTEFQLTQAVEMASSPGYNPSVKHALSCLT